MDNRSTYAPVCVISNVNEFIEHSYTLIPLYIYIGDEFTYEYLTLRLRMKTPMELNEF